MTRREALGGLSLAAAGLMLPRHLHGQAPGIITAPGVRPMVTDGVASTLVGDDAAVVWARADRAARMIVEYATSDTFRNVRRVVGPSALESHDFTARVHLADLPRGQRVFYRVVFQDLSDIRQFSEPVAGQLGTAPAPRGRDVSLVF